MKQRRRHTYTSISYLIRSIIICFEIIHALASTSSSVFSLGSKSSSFGTTIVPSSTKNSNYKEKDVISPFMRWSNTVIKIRGGDDSADESATAATAVDEEEMSFDDRVEAAMKKFGIKRPDTFSTTTNDLKTSENCEGGVCKIPTNNENQDEQQSSSSSSEPLSKQSNHEENSSEGIREVAKRIASDFNIDEAIAMSALHASSTAITDPDKISDDPDSNYILNEQKAREIIQYEMDVVKQKVPDDSNEVRVLVEEGYDVTMVKRALALTDMNVDDARAVLLAEKEDEEAEEQFLLEQEQQKQQQQEEEVPVMKTVSVDSNFDPTTPIPSSTQPAPVLTPPSSTDPPKKPEIYKCTTSEIQSLILESPIPVLLDIYADWCGPCKQLTPALEQMCTKSNGLFRLVKLNADEERGVVQSVLGVTAFPTLFGIREGTIINRSVGSPQSEEDFRAFMMKMVTGKDETGEFEEMTMKLAKMAGNSAISFSQRERMQTLIQKHLSALLTVDCKDDMIQAESCAKLVRTLLSKVIQYPKDLKYRKINSMHPALAILQECPTSLKLIKTAGFQKSSAQNNIWTLKEDQKVINIAPLLVVRDSIDKWMDVNRYEIAKAARKAKEDRDRENLQLDEYDEEYDNEEDDEEQDEEDTKLCKLKLRMEGKKQVHDMEIDSDASIYALMTAVKERFHLTDQEDDDHDDDDTDAGAETPQELHLICASKRLILKSFDAFMMKQSLKEHGLSPSASLVLKVIDHKDEESTSTDEGDSTTTTSSIAERVKAKKKKKTGSHTMQSTGIYAKDDNNKAELIDGGGGVLYEHDVSDDEDEVDVEELDQDENIANENKNGDDDEDDETDMSDSDNLSHP